MSRVLTLCMIVKNEAQNLARCLASVRAVVDEIVIVDTGSTDATIDIAKRYDAHVNEIDFSDVDFARARNRSLSLARGDWVLVLDADECLEVGSAAKARALVETGAANVAFIVSRKNIRSEPKASKQGVLTDFATRIFPNRPDFRYAGRVHETVDDSVLASGGRLRTCDVVLEHHLASEAVLREKSARYSALLRVTLAADPDDVSALSFLAVEYHKQGNYEEAMRITERLVELRPRDPVHHLNAGIYHFAHGRDRARARADIEKALALKPNDAAAISTLAWLDETLTR